MASQLGHEFLPDGDSGALETPRNPAQSLSITAFARFEFEAGKGNDGTKILMVEWEDDDLTRDLTGSWHVSWEGKKTVLPADEQTNESTRRLYFLLPYGVTVPPTITLTYEPPPNSASTVKRPERLLINPLPAIFPPELGATARTAGKKGVLHTIWGKKRLQVLEQEIKHESEYNLEGIALEMAVQEKEWIEANFGITTPAPRPTSISIPSSSQYPIGPLSPSSPRSPGGRRLSEKLKGLSLGTSQKDLSRKPEPNFPLDQDSHPLSPESPDVAVSSFGSFRNTPISAVSSVGRKRPVAQAPPDFIQAQQSAGPAGSMDFIARQSSRESRESKDSGDGDELFAKALSPRTPYDAKSPFSFSLQETMPYLKQESPQ